MKQNPTAYRESQSQISPQTEPKEQTEKKGKGCGIGSGSGRRNRPPPLFSSNAGPAPLQQIQAQTHHQTKTGMRALFLGGSGSRTGSCGTGVFLPRGSTAPSEPRKKSGNATISMGVASVVLRFGCRLFWFRSRWSSWLWNGILTILICLKVCLCKFVNVSLQRFLLIRNGIFC